LRAAVAAAEPEEIYHLAGQSDVGLSFKQPEETGESVALGTVRLLEAVRHQRRAARIFHASSSHIFGDPETAPQDEQTPFRPASPYACAKAFATHMVAVYRQRHGMFACNGILYNHESPRRGPNFVTQKICLAAAAIKRGEQKELRLGNIAAQRDWGDARDYVEGMWLSLQAPEADDYVFATGQLHMVQDVLETAFGSVGLDWREYVRQDPELVRPEGSRPLVGNPGKAYRALKWRAKRGFSELIREMTAAALETRSV
jgi:GDPmannose 4,6-dehydratase